MSLRYLFNFCKAYFKWIISKLVMKAIFFSICILFSIVSFAQEIKSSTIDGFTNERTVETSILTLKQGLTTGLGTSYSSNGRNYYLNIIGYGSTGTLIGENDKVWFVLTDGSVVKLEYRAQIPFNGSDIQNIYVHHYIISLEDVEILKNRPATLLRIVSTQGNTDIPLPNRISKKFSKLSDLFLREVSKDIPE